MLTEESHIRLIGDRVWINKTLFKDAYSKSHDKLSAKRFGPFSEKKLVGKNAVKVELPSNFKIYDVVHVIHTAPYD